MRFAFSGRRSTPWVGERFRCGACCWEVPDGDRARRKPLEGLQLQCIGLRIPHCLRYSVGKRSDQVGALAGAEEGLNSCSRAYYLDLRLQVGTHDGESQYEGAVISSTLRSGRSQFSSAMTEMLGIF